MKLRPLHDRVLIRRVEPEAKTAGGKSGDRVLFGKWSGTEVKLDGEELMIMKEADIMGVVDHVASAKKAA
jgi:chaperonin GroES